MRKPCPLCQAEPPGLTFAGVCESCATTLALEPMPPSKRPPLPCHRCKHRELIRVLPRELTSVPGTGSREVAPMFAVYGPTVIEGSFFSGREVNAPDPQNGAGKMEMYICRGCGFTEWYCQDPSEIPIDPLYSTEAVSVGGDGPLR